MTEKNPRRIADVALHAMKQLGAGNIAQAEVLATLAAAQQHKAENIIAYLNSDVSQWAEDDEHVVRQYLGLEDAE